MALTTGALYLVGGLCVLAVVVGDAPPSQRLDLMVIPVLSMVSGIVVMLWGRRYPWWFFHLSVLAGNVLVVAQIALGRGLPVVEAALPMYVFVILGAAFFFSLRGLAFHLAHVLVATTIVLPLLGVPWESAVTVTSLCLGVAAVVAFICRAADAIEVDALTGLLNRRGIERRLSEMLGRREDGDLTLVLLELDGFKEIKANEGNQYGDHVLRQCAERMRKLVPRGIELGRYDGDEFALIALIASGWSAEEGVLLADSLRTSVPLALSVSAGIASWKRGDTASILLERADVALLGAKVEGRERTLIYGGGDPVEPPPDPEGPKGGTHLRSV